MLHKTFISRQIKKSGTQGILLVLAVALSIMSLIALGGMNESITASVSKDARSLLAADFSVSSLYPISDPVINLIEEQDLDSTMTYEFISIVRTNDNNSLLSDLKVVGDGYPFYGNVELASGREFREVLKQGTIIVEQNVLDRLGLEVGTNLLIGDAELEIGDVVVLEPDRPAGFFNLGPRIFISEIDKEAINLIGERSRVRYTLLAKLSESKESALEEMVQQISSVAIEDQEQVETYLSADSSIKQFFDNFLYFLSVIGIFTLLLAGIGIENTVTAMLREDRKTFATLKTLGTSNRFLMLHYFVIVLLLGLVGTVIGLLFGLGIYLLLPILFAEYLPASLVFLFPLQSIIQGVLLGLVVVILFTIIPLYQLRDLKPIQIFRSEQIKQKRDFILYGLYLLVFLLFCGLVIWQIGKLQRSVFFIGGTILLLFCAAILTKLILTVLRRLKVSSLTLRQALRGLFRPSSATAVIIITMIAALSVLFSIYVLEENLHQNFVASYPEDSPSLFVIDIQPDQIEGMAELLGDETVFYPVVRARVTKVNEEVINREQERTRDGDNFGREFSMTYRNNLLDSEYFVEGDSLFGEGVEVPVSIHKDVLEIRELELGDTIDFRIQGIPLKATITSVRDNTGENLEPYFYFVFPPEILQDAPQTVFTALDVAENETAQIQNSIVSAYPNVSVINIAQTLKKFSGVVGKLTSIIRFFGIFSLLAGILIIISSVFASRYARTQEAVYYKVLGAKRDFVAKVFALENVLIGFICALVAALVAHLASFVLVTRVFDLHYTFLFVETVIFIGITVLIIVVVGLISSLRILREKPITFLRRNSNE